MSIGLQRAHSLPINAVETYLSSVSTSVTLTESGKVALINASTAPVTVTLPAPKNGLMINIKKIDSSTNAVIIAPASGTIDGAANKPIYFQYDSLTVTSDGTNYFLI